MQSILRSSAMEDGMAERLIGGSAALCFVPKCLIYKD